MENEEIKDDFADLPEPLRAVALQYGRPMTQLVMAAGMAREAVAVLANLSQKHQSRHGLNAAGIVANSFNQVSNALIAKEGWDEGTLAQCDRDIMRAFASAIQVAQPGSVILGNN